MTLFITYSNFSSLLLLPSAVPTFPSVPYLQIHLVCLPLISTSKPHVHTKQSVGRTPPVVYPNLHHLPTTDFAYQWPLASDSHFMLQHTLNLRRGHRPISRPNGAERTQRTQTTRRRASTGLRPPWPRKYQFLRTFINLLTRTNKSVRHTLSIFPCEMFHRGREVGVLPRTYSRFWHSPAVERNTLYVVPIDLV